LDGQRFDALAKYFASARSRRGLLKTVLATTVGLLGGAGAEVTEAAPRCAANGTCDGVLDGGVCLRNRCVCPKGERDCNGACVNTRGSNRFNCGSCGRKCGDEAVCREGRCTCDGPGLTLCSGECVDTRQSGSHCGGCGRDCPICMSDGSQFGALCVAGQCEPVAFEGHSFQICNGKCVDTRNDSQSCGSCTNRCQKGKVCDGGVCNGCPTGKFACKGISGCHDFSTDPEHCNGCFKKCPFGANCTSGECRCPEGQVVCKDPSGTKICVDKRVDQYHCGRCNRICNTESGETCSAGKCDCENAALTHCDDECVDTQQNNRNCGGCGQKCPLCISQSNDSSYGVRCVGGQCAPPEDTGINFAICGDACLDLDYDRRNCGTCGNKCATGVECIQGSCGCPNDQSKCGDGCCAANRICCDHNCCDAGVTSCSNGQCACPAGKVRCQNGGCAVCCSDSDCGENQVCVNQVCQDEGEGPCTGVRGTPTQDLPCCRGLGASISACDSGGNYCLVPQTGISDGGVCQPPEGSPLCRDACDCAAGPFACVDCVNGLCIYEGGRCNGHRNCT